MNQTAVYSRISGVYFVVEIIGCGTRPTSVSVAATDTSEIVAGFVDKLLVRFETMCDAVDRVHWIRFEGKGRVGVVYRRMKNVQSPASVAVVLMYT